MLPDTALTVFAFDTAAVRTLTLDGEPWFVATDIANVLSFKHVPHMVRMLDEDEKGVHIVDTLGGKQEVSIINESGMYACALKSRRPEAKAFRKWITSEVLPALRRQGSYTVPGVATPDGAPTFLTGNPAHAADQLVAADRIFRGILRSSRSAGVPLAHAIRRAGEAARARTGVDILAELDAPDPVDADLEPEAPDPTGAHAFYEAWRSGAVPLPFAPCFSTDFYAGYLHWSQAQGSWPATVVRFLAVVGRRHDVRKLRARYMDATGRASILTFVVPEEERMPPGGLTQTEWLSHSARQFVQALEAWRSQPT